MKAAVGLDMGTRFAKAVRVVTDAGGLRVAGYAMREVQAAPDGRRPEGRWLRQLLEETGWSGEPVAAAVPANATAVRHARLPFIDDDRLEEVVRFEMENHFPFQPEDVVVDHLTLERRGSESEIAMVCVQKRVLASLLDRLRSAGVDPVLVGAEPPALCRALEFGVEAPAERCLVLDIGASGVKAVSLAGGRPDAMRVLRMDAPDPAEDAVRYATALVGRLGSMLTGPPEERPSIALLTGGGATPGMAGALSHALGIEARCAVPMAEPAAGPAGDLSGRGLTALGLALSLVRPEPRPVNLRKGEFRYRPRLAQLSGPLTFLLAAWLVLAAVLAAGLWLEQRKLERRGAELAALESALWRSLSPGQPQPRDLFAWFSMEERRLAALSANDGSLDAVPVLRVLNAVLTSVPDGIPARIRSTDLGPGRLRVEMETNSHGNAAAIATSATRATPFTFAARNLRYVDGDSVFTLEADTIEGTPDAR